jgi:hypothetical protein
MKTLILIALSLTLTASGFAQQRTETQRNGNRETPAAFVGRWHVKFLMRGLPKNLIADVKADGTAAFELLDTSADDGPVLQPQPAEWSSLGDERISIAGDAELPLGTCCRERGTLVLKGKFTSPTSISGKLVFLTSTDDDESPVRLRAEIGTFTATLIK